MEKTVTLRFYDVRRTSEDKPAFADVLQLIANKPMVDRAAHVGVEDVLVRLEDFGVDGNEIHGQFVRGQSGNRPRPNATGRNWEPTGRGAARPRDCISIPASQWPPGGSI